MFKTLIISFLLVTSVYAKSINIAVAANVSYAIDELKEVFNKQYPDTNVRVTLGSSGKLTAQIKHGAPYELFMSANMKYPKALHVEKLAITKPIVYAQGSLAILSNKKQDFHQGINLLRSDNIQKIAIANPKTAPYGKATLEVFKNSKIYEDIKSKLVFGESISQTVSYAINAADLGFVAKSSLYSPKMTKYKENINWVELDSKLYTPIEQGVVLLKNSTVEAKQFYDFILSDEAKEIFKRYGYIVR